MTKREIIELYLADLNNLVPDSDAKRSRIIDLEDELEALNKHDVSVSDCISKNEVLHYMDIDTIGACSKCGSMKQY
jgi:hypothetical protein